MASLFVRARDAWETYNLGAGGLFYNAGSQRHQESDLKGATDSVVKAQKDASDLAKAETDRVRGEKEVEKRRINEKQIRQLRGKFRPSGFLNNQATAGVSGDLPNKLGA